MNPVTIASFLTLTPSVLLLFFRCLGVVWFSPCFGNTEVSRFWRIVLAFTLTTLIFPTVGGLGSESTLGLHYLSVGFLLSFVVDLMCEALLGASVGLTLKCFFGALHLAGEVISRLGGISVVGAYDSCLGEETSQLSRFYTFVAFIIFALCGGFELLIDGLLRLCVEVPPGSSTGVDIVTLKFVEALSYSFVLALKLSAPVILTTGVLYSGICFANRVTPQISLSSTSFSLSSLLTLSALFLTFGVSCLLFKEEMLRFVERLLPLAP